MTQSQRPKQATKSGPRKMTPRRLENIARFYLERFATTAANLCRVLQRRAARANRVHGGDTAETDEWIAQIVDRMVRAGIVDDARYAADKAASLRRLGRGPGRIRTVLAAKGVPRALIEMALSGTAETEDGADASAVAARAYAKRRRFGIYGTASEDRHAQAKKQGRELAAMGRAGFSYAVSRKALTEPDDD